MAAAAHVVVAVLLEALPCRDPRARLGDRGDVRGRIGNRPAEHVVVDPLAADDRVGAAARRRERQDAGLREQARALRGVDVHLDERVAGDARHAVEARERAVHERVRRGHELVEGSRPLPDDVVDELLGLLAHERAHAGLERRIEIHVTHERVEPADAEQLSVEEPNHVLRRRVGHQPLRLRRGCPPSCGACRRVAASRSCGSGAEPQKR